MSKPNDYYDKPLYVLSENFLNIMLCNFYFILCNIIFIFYAITITLFPDSFSLLMLLLSLIPCAPAFTALCCSMATLSKTNDVIATKVYFQSYKKNFFQSLKIWSVILFIIFIFILDWKYFIDKGNVLGFIFIPLIIFALLTSIYSFPLLSMFDINTRNIFIISIYYAIKNLKLTIIKITLLIISIILYYFIPVIGTIFLFSIIAFTFMYFDIKLFKNLENKYTCKIQNSL